MENLFAALQMILTPDVILWIALGMSLGILVGAIPGLTATMAVSLLLSITYGMDVTHALAVLIAVYLGGIYGGSRSAILLNVPGTPSSAATSLDGFPLAKKGQATVASLLATTGSMIGGLIGVVILAVAAPVVASFALKFAAWEYFWLGIFGIVIAANLSEGNLIKGLLGGMLGLLITTIGMDPIYGGVRLVFGNRNLVGGVSMLPAMIGLFGMAEVFCSLSENVTTDTVLKKDTKEKSSLFRDLIKAFKLNFSMPRNVLVSSVIGTFIGAVPGVGPDIASWVAYDTEKRSNKNKEEFGKGSFAGLLASETANNAATSGVFIPLLTLGIPGCAVSAVILGGMRLHGLRPGPTFFIDQGELIYYIIGILILSNLLILILGTIYTKPLSKVVSVPYGIIMPFVAVFAVIGSYAMSYRVFDIIIMFAFGIIGYVLRKADVPSSPLVLSLILGNIIESNFRRGLIVSETFAIFFTRPISLALVILMVVIVGYPVLKRMYLTKKN